ncbi:type I restriction endonuclease subunit R [Polaribacter marinivivus]|uniref:type I restriction endonuclease subunit R n=1 Tax=Polaribacter marinivivus TaxID=1524260 RepID=UPI003D351B49
MKRQSEQALENNLVQQLIDLKYEGVTIPDEAALLANLKSQLEKHNKQQFSEKEFKKIVNHLNKGNVFEKAKILRDKMHLLKDNGTSSYIEFLNQEHWCQNQFQVTQQVTIEGTYKNRYDVTLLINGLPLVQIELKRRGLELKEAFKQINRYHRHSYGASNALFNYIQIFVISNGVNTKYFANNKHQSFKQTFYWSDSNNKKITNLSEFTNEFLEPCHISKMICKYIVLAEATKILMVLRPYQYYATERIIERVKNSNKNGYIWHTTGSGKTLTSFKSSQILMQLPEVHKVVFVVDRKDLDFQTTKEFNSFSEGSVDGTDNTRALVKQFKDDTKLIVTTIQKLNNAVSSSRYASVMEPLQDKKMVFIFDECHRSQFGDTHDRITKYFHNRQLFGFTGTPIFVDNASKNDKGKRTTKDLFGDCLHKYVITDAIKDDNVLKFSIEYVGRYKEKINSNSYVDIDVEAIDTKELLESDTRLEKIAEYIVNHHDRKTHSRSFTGLFCTSRKEILIKYYAIFKRLKQEGKHNLKIATIFSYGVNEEDENANDEDVFTTSQAAETELTYETKHSRDKLEEFIGDYNKEFGTNFTTKDSQSYYNYFNDIAKRVKSREIDILLVVNMFLTGFDSKALNTLYVDKNLRYHGLIQAYSRTNRILGDKKSQGNIVCFRNLKKATDEAIALFSNKEAKEVIIMQPYEDYIKQFQEKYKELIKIVPTVDAVDELQDENETLEFVKSFRSLMRVLNVLKTFSDFSHDDLDLTEQEFEDYKSKYLDVYEGAKTDKEKVSILNDVDFELELIQKDEINVAYILQLLALSADKDKDAQHKTKNQIVDIIASDPQLRSKKELIEQFIEENIASGFTAEEIPDKFEEFWSKAQQEKLAQLCDEEKLDKLQVQAIIEEYIFSNQIIDLRDKVSKSLLEKQKLFVRRKTISRVIEKIENYLTTFLDN